MLMQEGEVYLGRGRKGNIRKESRKRERTWRYAVGKRGIGQRRQGQQQGAQATERSKADRCNGCKDMKLAEKWWRYADAWKERRCGREILKIVH